MTDPERKFPLLDAELLTATGGQLTTDWNARLRMLAGFSAMTFVSQRDAIVRAATAKVRAEYEAKLATPQPTSPSSESEVWGFAIVNRRGALVEQHYGPAFLSCYEARKLGLPRDGEDWTNAHCALLNANTADPSGPFTVIRLYAGAAFSARVAGREP